MPVATLAQPVARAIKRVKRAVQSNEARLRDALREVEGLRDALEALAGAIDAKDKEQDEAALRDPRSVGVKPMAMARMRGWLDDPFTRALNESKKLQVREVLKTACEAKLAVVSAEASEVEKSVRRELSDEGFDDDELGLHPRLKRAKGVVATWQRLVAQCTAEKNIARLWRQIIPNFVS